MLRFRKKTRYRVPLFEQMHQSECGLCCLQMILSYYRCEISLPEIREKVGGGRDGFNLLTIKELANSYAMDSQGKKLAYDMLHHLPLPAILFWEGRHYVVLEKVKNDKYFIVDPALGRLELTGGQIREQYSGFALTATPNQEFKAFKNKKSKLRYFKGITSSLKIIMILLVVSLLMQLTTLAVPILIKNIIDNTTTVEEIGISNTIGFSIILLIGLQILFSYIHGSFLIKLQNRLDTTFMSNFISHLFLLPYKFFEVRSSGDLILRTNSNIAIREIVSTHLISSILNIFMIITLFIYMISQSVGMALCILSIGILQIIIIFLSKNKLKMYSKSEIVTESNTSSFLTESIHGVSVIKSMGIEEEIHSKWSELFNNQIKASTNLARFKMKIDIVVNALNFASPLIIIWVGIHQVTAGTMTLGTLFAFQTIAVSFLTPLNQLALSVSDIVKIETLLERIFDILDTKAESEVNSKQIKKLKGNISLEDVSFKYDKHSSKVIDSVSLEIKRGMKVSIIGKTGSGKSTLAALLVGLYEQSNGNIVFDDQNLKTLNKSDLRKKIGVVMQDDFLFNQSIKENITMYNPLITFQDVEEATKLAEIYDDILKMPMEFETIISETGSNISGGQRQRIALARALAKKPSILLLDEATSALDTITESKIDHNLNNLKCTRIVIAHRLSTIINSDLIILLDDGEIIATGSHYELISNSPEYKEFYKKKSAKGDNFFKDEEMHLAENL